MLKELVKKNVGSEEWFNKWKAHSSKSVSTEVVLHKPVEFNSAGKRGLLHSMGMQRYV